MKKTSHQPHLTPAAIGALATGDFANAVVAATPGGIEAQEAAGQVEFLTGDTLPQEILRPETRSDLERFGIVFGDEVDDLFIEAKLPEGWSRKGTDHSMWSEIRDEEGRCRMSVFYKAAFYDRKAHVSVSPRYIVAQLRWSSDGEAIPMSEYDRWRAAKTGRFVVRDEMTAEIIYEGPEFTVDEVNYPSSEEADRWIGAQRPGSTVDHWLQK